MRIRMMLLLLLPLVPAASSAFAGLQYQETKLAPADFAHGFGSVLSIDGDTAIVGAAGDDNGGTDSGAAYVFQRGQGAGWDAWTQIAKLKASDAAAFDAFGAAVALSGDTVLIGAAGDEDEGSGVGSAYVFERDAGGPNNWGQVKKLETSVPHDFIGRDVSLSGDTAIIADRSQAYLFRRDVGGAGNWGEIKIISMQGSDFFDGVSIDGDTAVIGSTDIGGSGGVYVLGRNHGGPDNWGEVKQITKLGGHEIGDIVALSGDVLLATAPFSGGGSAVLYERDEGGADNWGETATLAGYGNLFGSSADIDGDTAVVGAYGSEAVHIFTRGPGGGDWLHESELVLPDPQEADRFGWSSAISGRTVLGGMLFRERVSVYEPESARMFVTAGDYAADFGGLSGGDALCRAEAQAGAVEGIWKAFLSVPGTDRHDRIPVGLPIERIDRAPLADDSSDLNGPVDNPVDRDPTGVSAPIGSRVWTGDTDADGSCLGFSATAGDVGEYGITSEVDLDWQAAGDDACTASNRLYCFQFNCPLAPDPGCNDDFAKGTLLVKEAKVGKEKIRVDFKSGPALAQSDLGTPLDVDGTAYTACFYDDAGELAAQMEVDRAGELCSGKPCWLPIGGFPPGGKGYRYKDATLSQDGVQSVQLKGGTAGKSKISIRGANKSKKGFFGLPRLAKALLGSTSATVQLHGNDVTQCFSVTVNTSKSTETFFHAKR